MFWRRKEKKKKDQPVFQDMDSVVKPEGTITIPCKNKANSFTTFRVEKENTTYNLYGRHGRVLKKIGRRFFQKYKPALLFTVA